MNTTLTRGQEPTTPAGAQRRSRRPVACALGASVEAVRDALAHMDDGAVLAVPIGTPHENFDVVEWCAANGKPVINRFDPWPLDALLVENALSQPEVDVRPLRQTETDPTTDRRGRRARRPFGRTNGTDRHAGGRSLDDAWHSSNVATARSHMAVGAL